jgi:hypothetical protein
MPFWRAKARLPHSREDSIIKQQAGGQGRLERRKTKEKFNADLPTGRQG